ncbi:hypothetical protein B0H11DRAFT_2244925 [Mycena galericulata]|nr:hypothetical protein B0H11DRAFT_2244925 [Mycena galericulata]
MFRVRQDWQEHQRQQMRCCKREDAEKATRERAESAKATAIQVRPDAHAARMSGGPQALRVSQQCSQRATPRAKIDMIHQCSCLRICRWQTILAPRIRFSCYKESFGYEEMVEDVMKAWAYAWDDLFNASLLRREVLVFFHNGLNCHPNSMSGTLGEFFNLHSQLYNSEVFLKVPSKLKGSVKEPALVLNFVIDMTISLKNGLNPRTELGPLSNVVGSLDRMKNPKQSEPLMDQLRLWFPTILALEYQQNLRVQRPRGNSKFSKQMTIYRKDKKVFELDVNGTLYIAKRAITVGIDPDTFLENENLLHSNLVALWNIKCVLDAFYVAADGVSILDDIDTNLAVQETFLVEELLSAECPPSVASGVSHELLKEAQDEFESRFDYTPGHQLRVIWLIQSRMSPICERWNLMDATKLPNPRNKFGTTVTALSHFFATLSHHRSFFRIFKVFGKIITDVIFQNDVGGIPRRTGDKGTTGVEMVLNAHICNRVCELLGLDNDESDKGQGGEDDDDDE